MSSLTVKIDIINGGYQITGFITSTGDMPSDIFMYENSGTATLGAYQGVCTLDEYKNLQTFSGTPIPAFGNRFLKANSLVMNFPLSVDAVAIKAKIIADVKSFKASYTAALSTTEVVSL